MVCATVTKYSGVMSRLYVGELANFSRLLAAASRSRA